MVTFKYNKQYKSDCKGNQYYWCYLQNEIESMNKQIEKLSKEIWQIHSLLLNKSEESSGD